MTPEQFDATLADIAAGEPAYKAAVANGAALRSFWRLIATNEEAWHKYTRAKELGLERMAEEIVELADESREGVKTTTKGDGSVETVTGDMVERSRLQIESRKWLLSKLKMKKYGDATTLRGDPDAPLEARVTVEFVRAAGAGTDPGAVPVPLAAKG